MMKLCFAMSILAFLTLISCSTNENVRSRIDFNEGWKFQLGDNNQANQPDFNDSGWRNLNLPHDWSIEGEFSQDNPTKVNGGALPAGIGWYRKSFKIDQSWKQKQIFIDFDGVYRNSEVWVNGHFLGKRPFGYSSFRYDLTPFLKFDGQPNQLAVRVDNSAQPNSRWYTGSGIYRNIWLVATSAVYVDHWGTFVTTPEVSEQSATVKLEVKIRNKAKQINEILVATEIFAPDGKQVGETKTTTNKEDSVMLFDQQINLKTPVLWSTDNPVLYSAITKIYANGELTDQYETPFGIRFFRFNPAKGFFLNGKPMKILGVNNHHDLGALGAAFNTRAAERQLEILKVMGCNAIRMSHNPPAPELLDLCDRMGFIVMDEAFDIWIRQKLDFDYHMDWPEWHQRDLEDMVLRDRNHPSVMMWSIGNEIPEQFDSIGIRIGKEMVGIVKKLDTTRPVTSGLTEQDPAKNYIYQSKALDLISFNYKHLQLLDFPKNYPGESLLAAENMSAFATRGHYDMPSDSVRIWPQAYTLPLKANADFTASSYDNCHALWGATHEETWKMIKSHDFISGMFVWSGFDFLGEPDPYKWPARSSYYGVIDLCGFPKDMYYFYQSEWTNKTMLHVFPHWNWQVGQLIDIWAYYNNADEVELFLNDVSQGVRSKTADQFHAMWRVKYQAGRIKAVSRKDGKTVLERIINTAGKPAKIEVTADRTILNADGIDLSFITVKVTDESGNMVPDASNLVNFKVSGNGFIAGVDNGCQTSMEPFKANYRKAFNGMCLLIVQTDKKPGTIQVEATSEGLAKAELKLETRK
jgi:beta-galactosidase